MIDPKPIQTDGRERRRQAKFVCAHPTCLFCGSPDLEALTPVAAGWLKAHGIELHHVVGQKHDPDLVVPLCLNCHRKVTENLAKAGVSMDRESDTQMRVAMMLEALAVFFEMLIDALRRWASLLRQPNNKESAK